MFSIRGAAGNERPHSANPPSSCIDAIQRKQELLAKSCEQFPTCDVKAQAVLKALRADKELWCQVNEKLEVRVIKAVNEQEIVLHPQDEATSRWSGNYHVYITVQHGDERLVIDPYVGGDQCCAHLSEADFIKHHWRGKEGKDFILETVAPTEEILGGDDYIPSFSLLDYMNELFNPDVYPAHQFFYDMK